MRELKFFLTCAMVLIVVLSCAQAAEDVNVAKDGCTVASRVDGTRVSYEANASGEVEVEWQEGDVLYVATTDGTWGSNYSSNPAKRFVYNASTGLFECGSATLPAGEYTFIAEFASESQYRYFTSTQCTHKLPSLQSQGGVALGHLSENDCMVAQTKATITSGGTSIPTFTMLHLYSLLRIKVENESSTSFSASSITALFDTGTNVTGIYRVTNFADGSIALNNSGYGKEVTLSLSNFTVVSGATADAWLLIAPMIYSGDLTIRVSSTSGTSVSRVGSLSNFSFERGKVHDVTVKINDSGDGGSSSDDERSYMSKATGWAELPAMPTSNPNLQYWTHEKLPSNNALRNYSMCFDVTKYCALWIAYPLHNCYISGDGKRTDEWGYDPCCVNDDYEPYLKNSYYSEGGGTNTHSRGHQLPSADRLASNADNATTFYYSNMTPQLQSLNGATWETLESDLRKKWICSDTLYVVTGAHFDPNVKWDYAWDAKGLGKACPVPTHYYKVLLRTKDGNTGKRVQDCTAEELKCVGFWFDHKANAPRQMKSVREIEELTGHTFFSNVSNAPKESYSTADWQ